MKMKILFKFKLVSATISINTEGNDSRINNRGAVKVLTKRSTGAAVDAESEIESR